MNTISRDDLRALISSGVSFVLAEALDAPYFEKGHLTGAINMPLGRVAEIAKRAIGSASSPVVVYCASATCENSHIVARKLDALGYTDVRVHAGGKADWEAAGLPLERSAA
jgi:rhodanese-related sulfurtransferase